MLEQSMQTMTITCCLPQHPTILPVLVLAKWCRLGSLEHGASTYSVFLAGQVLAALCCGSMGGASCIYLESWEQEAGHQPELVAAWVLDDHRLRLAFQPACGPLDPGGPIPCDIARSDVWQLVSTCRMLVHKAVITSALLM